MPNDMDPQGATDSLYQHTEAGEAAAAEPVSIPGSDPPEDDDESTVETWYVAPTE